MSFVISLLSAVFYFLFLFLYICLHGFCLSIFFSFLDIVWTDGVNVLFGFVFYFIRCGCSFFDPLLSAVVPFFMISGIWVLNNWNTARFLSLCANYW